MNIILEYLIVFISVYILNTFIAKINKKNSPKDKKNVELLYLKKIYNINIKKINKDKFSKIITIINTFIISTIYIILIYLLDNLILRIIVGIILLILMMIICYGLLGRYYAKKEGK